MNKRFGFTLAEVLITLGIIGVVAALTAPALMQNVQEAKTGPTLAKAVSTFENAVQLMLTQEEASSITGLQSNAKALGEALMNYMDIAPVKNDNHYHAYDGSHIYQDVSGHYFTIYGKTDNMRYSYSAPGNYMYYISYGGSKEAANQALGYKNQPSNQVIGKVYVDINGTATPNKVGKDLFLFYLYNNGSLRPYGAQGFDRGSNAHNNVNTTWKSGNCDASSVKKPETCAGSIFENKLKVVY